jgi:hypothetical protein
MNFFDAQKSKNFCVHLSFHTLECNQSKRPSVLETLKKHNSQRHIKDKQRLSPSTSTAFAIVFCCCCRRRRGDCRGIISMGQRGSKDVFPMLFHRSDDENTDDENDGDALNNAGVDYGYNVNDDNTGYFGDDVIMLEEEYNIDNTNNHEEEYHDTIDHYDEGRKIVGVDDLNFVSIPDGNDDVDERIGNENRPQRRQSGNRNGRQRSTFDNDLRNRNGETVIHTIQDHFSLGDSTTLRFRSKLLRIFEDGSNQQFVLEQDSLNSTRSMKQQRTNSQIMLIRRRLHQPYGLDGNDAGGQEESIGIFRGTTTWKSAMPISTVDQPALSTTTSSSSIYSDSQQNATFHVTHTTNFGMAFLRTLYTLVSIFIMTVLFCFTAQCILFLFMNLVGVETPETWTTNPPTMSVVGATLAVPLLLYSGGSMMSISWAFVVDCWKGISNEKSSLFRQMVFWNSTITEWVCFIIFLVIPMITLALSTLFGTDSWWQNTVASWAISVGCFQIFYMLLVFVNEVNMCSALVQKFLVANTNDDNNDQREQEHHLDIPNKWLKIMQMNIVLTQRQKWSGYRYERYLVEGNDIPPPLGYSSDPRYVPVQWYLRWGTRLTLYGCSNNNTSDGTIKKKYCGYTILRPPVRNYSMDEVFGNVMILTSQNWSLERLWCMDRKRSAAITLSGIGPSTVTSNQMMNGYICIVTGTILLLLVVGGFLRWAGQSAIATFFLLFLVFTFCLFPINYSSYLVFRFHRQRMVASEVREEGYAATEQQQQQQKVGEVFSSSSVLDLKLVDEGTTKRPPPPENAAAIVEQSTASEVAPAETEQEFPVNNNNHISASSRGTTFSSKSQPRRTGPKIHQPTESCIADKALISVWESVRVSEAQPWFCWMTFTLEVTVFYLWPLLSLSVTGNGPVAIVFGISGAFSLIRHYFNVTNLLHELGPIKDLDITSTDLQPAFCGLGGGRRRDTTNLCERMMVSWLSPSQYEKNRKLQNQALVAGIVKRVTRTNATCNWITVFFLLFLCVFAGFVMASTEESFDYKVKGVIFVNDFYYDPQPQLPYPTCSVQKGFAFPGMASGTASLADYAFLATQAFSGPDEAQPNLDQWFGPGLVIDEHDFVNQYRVATGTVNNPVSYKLFTFPSTPKAGIVSIRGSEAMWDWMVDIQLWTGGVLAQLIRAINPFGFIWDSILADVVLLINSVQSKKLKDVSYYRYTSQFVLDMYSGFDGHQYEEMRVTGASLGGGLAILTGAITGASAVAVSGLNAMYSRKTFIPPITAEQLNTRVFNVIPARDVIAHIDRPGDLYQRTQCRGPKNSLFGCHSMWRNLCELQYQCGSGTRPINCWCVSKYGYPPPIQNGTVSWDEACIDADE